MRRRNRFTLFLAIPLVVFFWIIGWSLYLLGSNKKQAKPRNRDRRKEITLTVVAPELEYAK
jgi:hypothetical protein